MSADAGSVELNEISRVCAAMRALNHDLFAELGRWAVADDCDRRVLYATACHRHAWHAELWARRMPRLHAEGSHLDGDERVQRLPDAPDADAYRALLLRLADDLDDLAARVDPVLDPSTTRVIRLVRRDVAELT